MDLTTTLIMVAFCILMEAFFSGSEIAMISISRLKMKQLSESGDPAAQSVLKLLENPERLFASTSLGTNLAMVSASAVFTAYMVTHLGEAGEWVSMLVVSPFILFGGEIVPKIVFQNHANSVMLYAVRPLNLFCQLFSPAIRILTYLSSVLTRGVDLKQSDEGVTFSRDQIQRVLSRGSESVKLDPAEQKMINRIFNFGEINVEQCMVPLIQMMAIPDTATLEDAHQMANESGFSRLPVFHGRMYNIIGLLNTFDLLNQPVDASPISGLIRPTYYVPQNKKIDDLLKDLQQRGLHMAVVVDEYGGCTGIVTIEDLLEEIVGEIEDEYDKPEKQYQPYADGGYLIEAEMEIGAINDTLGLELPQGDYETLGGLVIDRLEKIPHPGDQVKLRDYRLTVKESSKRKIVSVIVRKLNASENPENGFQPGAENSSS